VMDPATGETLAQFALPDEPEAKAKPTWGYIGVADEVLVAGSQFVRFSTQYKVDNRRASENFDSTSSRKLVAMDRHSGRVLWTRESELAFRHNAIAAGGGKLFAIDSLPEPILDALSRRGESPPGKARLLALDLKTGEIVWSRDEDVFGTWLSYDAAHDILLESGRASRDMIVGEPTNRMTALRGQSGDVLWDKPVRHGGPLMIHGETIYLNAVRNEGAAVELLTGNEKTWLNPLTGRRTPWSYRREYGCNSVSAGEHLLTFRSGTAGYYDLAGDGGTGNLGGFRSGCTSNLVVADGVLNAPDYTRTCTCTYPNQTSLAFVHAPDAEMWTFNPYEVGGPSPDVPIDVDPAPTFFYRHSLRFEGEEPAWVGASGLVGGGTIRLRLAPEPDENRDPSDGAPQQPDAPRYTVRLHFAEPDDAVKPGERVFDVAIDGKPVLESFDVVARAGGPRRTIVKEFRGVPIPTTLRVTLTPRTQRPPVLCGVEAHVE